MKSVVVLALQSVNGFGGVWLIRLYYTVLTNGFGKGGAK